MNFIKNPLILITASLLCSCGSGTMEPIEIQSQQLLNISGALNSTFSIDESNYQCLGTIKNWDIGYTLILSVKAKGTSINKNEQVSLYFYMPIGSDDLPITGKYYAHLLSDNFSGISYKNQWNQNSFLKYRFETGLARLVIEESDNSRLIGKFSLSAQQSYGQRTLNGQVEDINLANDGRITVSGKIDFELDI